MEKLEPKRIENILALSPLQAGMLFHYLKEPQSSLYFEQLSLGISGEINVKLFEDAWNVVIETNEMLRTVFRWEKLEKPSQVILKEHPCKVTFYDLSAVESRQRKTALEEIKDKDRCETFDLQQVPFRVILCKLADKQYEMIVSNHHILYDGWSNGIILKEFFMAYDALKLPTKPSFKEFIKWLQSRDSNKQKQFWREYLAGFETPTELPIKRKIPGTTGAENYSLVLEEEVSSKLDGFVKNNRVTLASVFYAAWGIVLQKYCGSEDVVFGTTVSGRSADIKGIEEMVGLFINTIPLRTQTIPGEKISDVVFRTDQALRGREEFENTPLVDIGSCGSGSLFDTLVAIENYPLDGVVCRDVARNVSTVHSYSMSETTHYDLSVGIVPFNEIKINFNYKQASFDKGTIENLAGHFKGIIQTIIDNPETALSQLEIISVEEKNRILNEFNNTAAEYPTGKTIQQLFEEQASRTPDIISLVGATTVETLRATSLQLTYRQLNEQSNRLAGSLIEKGVLPDNIVGIMVERSVEMVIGIFGILKSGGAYLPIDPSYPQERIDYMLKDSGAQIMVGNRHACSEIHHSSFIIHHSSPSNLAYIIYTSGSTGKPKGVMIEHGSVVNLLFAMQDKYPFTPTDTYLLKTSYIFDVSVTELFGWCMGGGRLAILEKNGEKDPRVICEWIERHHVTHINFVPSMFNAFVSQNINRLSSLKYIFLAGEALLPEFVNKFRDLNTGIRLENIYGPTESSVYASQYSLSGWNGIGSIPIGKPLPNIALYILNKYNHLQPLGIPGELCISGTGLARGYLNNPELTCEKFNQDLWDKKDDQDEKSKSFGKSRNPFSKGFLAVGDILYRTGDLARWFSDGNIEFLGRIDQQVKIRGFRVELGEIENLLLKHDRVKDAVVVLKEDETGDKNLAAYFVSDTALSDSGLRDYLLKVLPEYMIPAYFVRLEKIPLTPTGKVDRGALPAPEVKETAAYVAPRNEIEMKLAEIWAGILGRNITQDRIGIDDNFFRLGGHSLKATSLASLIHKLFNVKIPLGEIFKRPTIRGLFDYINKAVGEKYVTIEPVEEKEYYQLSSAQKRLYFLQQMDNAGTAYNISAAWVLEGIIDQLRLEQVIARLIQRHESLRTSFVIIGEEPVQRITKVFGPTFFQKGGPPGAIIRPFDLSQAPLLRAGLVQLEEEKHILIVDMHHIISDGISTEILVLEFTALYQGEQLPAISLRYRDYAEWQQGENGAYWKKQFAGEIPVLELPTDYARPAPGVQGFEGNRIAFALGRETVESLYSLALGTGTTLYMVLLALYSILLAKLSGQEDIITGTPVGGRKYAGLEKMIGVFVNTLALRSYPVGEKNFIEFLGEVKEKTLAAFENQEYPYEDLVEQVAINRDTGRNPLFDVMFVLQNMGGGELAIPGIKLAPYGLENKTSKFDLTLTGVETDGKLEFVFEYSTKLFKPATIERFITYFKNVVSRVLQDKGKRLSDLEILSLEEKNRLLYDFNDTAAGYPADKTIHQLFEEQASRTPDHIALVGATTVQTLRATSLQITYLQLNEQAGRLAGLLIEKGVLADNIVGIMMERSVEMIAGILGILKSGGAYMPIDPDYPQERIDYMLKDSTAKLLVNETFFGGSVPAGAVLQKSPHCSANLAYVIYTSGTTGQPKGSLIEHRNVVRLLFNDKFQFDFTDRDVWTLFHSFCFDFSVWEMYGALLYGGKLVIVPKMVARDTAGFLGLLGKETVTVLNQTPSAFYNLINETSGKPLNIKYVIFGGEALNPLKLKDWREKYPRTRLINMFGITETTVHVTYKEITETDMELDVGNVGNVGKPIPTLSLYVLDKYLKPVPLGTTGEIYVGGDGVARGYLNRPELTAEKFIFSPNFLTSSLPNFPLYRSGDLGRHLFNGDIETLGRIDHQVKIRGFRIELGEIENRLLQYEGIKDAVVLAEETGTEKHLCAYIVSGKEFTVTELRAHLAGKLPDYMIPSYFVRLAQIPLTPNGKIDRKALPGVHGNDELLAESAPPTSETEEKLVELWAKVLGITPGINADFFHSGGDSIKAVRLVNSINTKLSARLKIADIYINGTIRKLASLIDGAKTVYEYTKNELNRAAAGIAELKNRVMADPRLPEGIEDVYPMSDIQEGMVFHSLKDRESALYHDQMVYQPVINEFNPDIFKKAFILLVEKHPILRTVFIYDRCEEPVQAVYSGVPHDIAHDDLSHLEKEEQEDYLLRFLAGDRKKAFQFDVPPLWRLRTFALGHDNICVVFVAHHAILDGWSVASLDTELLNTYWQLKANPAFTPGMLRNSYKAFIIEQSVEKKRADAANFWRNELDGYQRLELPGNNGAAVGKYRFKLGKNLLSQVQETAKRHHTTVKNLCFGAYIYMLNMLTYEQEMVVGLVTNNRPVCEDGDKILGCFLNTIPVRIIIPAGISWLDYLKQVDRKLLELKKYERVPLFEIVSIIGENTQDRNPLFDVIFNFIDFHVLDQIERDYGKNNTGKLRVEENVTTNTAFDFSVSTTLGDFELIISYSESFFDEKTVGNLCYYFGGVLNKFIAEPGAMANKIELLPVEERHRLLYEFNDTGADYPKDKTIHELFAEQASKTPDHIALVGATTVQTLRATSLQITYRQLNEQSDRLAYLLIEKGVLADSIIGIMLERSIEMIVCLLGILKSGGAYLPIDPEYPQERIDYMLRDSGAKIMIGRAEERKSGRAEFMFSCFFPASPLPRFLVSNSSNLAYVIYTSGSTGKPKGVMIENRSVINFIKGITDIIPFQESGRILSLTTISFDIFGLETILPLTKGSTVIMGSAEEQRDAVLGARIMEREAVTIFQATPSRLQLFIQDPELGRNLKILKYLLVGGEVFPEVLLAKLEQLTNAGIYNLYGPTETTIWSTIKEVSGHNILNIGKPLANTFIYILNRGGLLQPVGVAGEICISGEGVARGYINRPELSAEKFEQDLWDNMDDQHKYGTLRANFHHSSFDLPRIHHSKSYHTGDLGRWLNDGNIECLGRIDHQVKIRGFRIELGEIENLLLKHEQVQDAVVVLKEDAAGDKYLAAYLVADGEISDAELREYLLKSLPEYMIPPYFMRLEKIPLTPSGKVDRRALPEPGLKSGEQYVAPRNEIEKKLVEIWTGILGRDTSLNRIGIDDNFFRVGGHSLKATSLVSLIQKIFNVKIPLGEIFKRPTIKGISEYIQAASEDITVFMEPAEEKEFYYTSSAQGRLYIIHQMEPGSTAYNMPIILDLKGLIQVERLEETFRKLIARHESLRTFFQLIEGKPVQRICKEVGFKIEKQDLSTASPGEKSGIIFDNFISAFDLSKAPLLRAILLKIEEEKHVLVIDMHHIISDGISQSVLVRDFLAAYRERPLSPLTLQYKDFSEWQRKQIDTDFFRKQEEYWVNRFTGEISLLNLPTDYSRPVVQSFKGHTIESQIGETLTGEIKAIAAEQAATLYMILLAAFTILISKYANQNDFSIGSPVAGRRHSDLEPIVGMFINVLLMRNPIDPQKSFEQFLDEVKYNAVQAFENQDYSIDQLAGRLEIKRDASRNPLYEVIFALVDAENPEFTIPGLEVRPVKYSLENTKTDLRLGVFEKNNEIITTLTYATALFQRKTAENMSAHYVEIIEQVAADKTIKIADIKISYHLTGEKNISNEIKIPSGQFLKEKEYWLDQLAGEVENCYFPYDNYSQESVGGEYRKEAVTFKISGDICARLMEITGQSYLKIHMVLVAGAAALSSLYTGNRDMIVGTSIERQDTEEPLINTALPLRISFPIDITFKELILQIREITNEAIENQNYPMETLISERGGLSDVIVLLENIQEKKYIEHLHPPVTFFFRAAANEIEGDLEYDASKYEKNSITRIIEHFLRLLHTALFDVNLKISDIQILSEQEKKALGRFNDTAAEYPHHKTIHQLFAEQASKTPDHIALVGAGSKTCPITLSYNALNEQSDRLAGLLVEKGVLPDNIVGIMMERSVEMVIGIMGILKSGGAYLPIAPEFPQDRVDYMLKDSGAKLLAVANDKEGEKVRRREGETVFLEVIFNSPKISSHPLTLFPSYLLNSSNLAYIIYTSGSTGKPKGVAVEHRAIVNYTWWAAKNYVKKEQVSFPLYTPMGFDLTLTSIFTPLVTGNTIYIYRGEEKDFLLDNILVENKVEVVKLTPLHLMLIGNNTLGKNNSKIKRFIVGGDKLESRWAQKIHENFGGKVEIYNEYGPTEATVGCMIYKCNPGKDKGASVPIGVPADNVEIYLLDKLMRDVPVGGIGELYIGGAGLARGYLNNPELTAEKFNRSDRSGKTYFLYKTGDLGRRLNDGNLEFLGRVDQQAKIRGYRIETGEIERTLMKHEHIHQAVVVVIDDVDRFKYLAAYVVLADNEEKNSIDAGQLRNYLSVRLPNFMIPSYFVKLDEIPLTTNGKVDKKALPDPSKNPLDTGSEYQPPGTKLESLMVDIWQDVMGIDKIGINDRYFTLGGDSIKAIQLSSRLYNIGWKLELRDLFQYPTIKELGNHLKPIKEISFQGIIEGEVKLTPVQEWFFEKNFTDPHHFNLSVMLHNPEGFDEEIIKKVFKKIMEHHDVLRMVFKKEDGVIKQINRGLTRDSLNVDIEVVDVKNITDYQKEMIEKCNHIQGSIDLSNGSLVKLGLFKSMTGDYLLIVIHHLVMDTVSWMILFEDFNSLYRQVENGIEQERLELPLKSTSYKEWAEKLIEYANSEQAAKELYYWQKLNDIEPVTITNNKGKVTCKVKNGKEISFELPGEYTEKLLKYANDAYNTETNDILLTALGMAASDWTDLKEIPLILEGHGREEIIPGVNINRTVGWFASMYPIVLNMKNKGDIGLAIKDIKEMIRKIPSKGIGFGILKYLTGKGNKMDINWNLEPGISFNYLGEFHEDRKQQFIHLTEMPQGNTVSLNSGLISPLYVIGIVFKGRLKISMIYDPGYYAENQIQGFVAGYQKYLVQVIDHCTAGNEPEFTLSDYSVSLPEKEAEIVFDFLSKIKLDE